MTKSFFSNSRFVSIASLLILISLSACSSFSLAEDITPPPGSEIRDALPTQEALIGPLYPLVPPDPSAGESIYLERCTPCHGITGKGDGPQAAQLPLSPTPLGSFDIAMRSAPSEWFSIITQGDLERFMPPFNSLSARQRWDVIAYIYTLATSPETLALGAEIYQANCAVCHGETGRGDGVDAASLATPPTDFTSQAVMAAKSVQDLYRATTQGIAPSMPAFEEELNQEERWAVATYLRSFTFELSDRRATLLQEPEVVDEDSPAEADVFSEPDPGHGVVMGEIVHASGGEVSSGLVVTLHGFDNMQETLTETTAVLEDGTYIFDDVDIVPGRAFISSVEYQGVIYGSEVIVAGEVASIITLPILVFESTTDPTVLSIDRLHIFFEYYDPDTLKVIELLIISNNSDRTVIPADNGMPVITFDLPEGASNLQFEDGILGSRYVQTSRGFGDNAVVRPGAGSHQIVFSYDMPYLRRLDLVQPFNIPVNAVVIMVPEDGVKVKSDQIVEAGSRPVQGVTYQLYTGDYIEAGSALSLSISGRPRTGSAGLFAGSGSTIIIGLSAFGLALIAAGVLLYRQSRTTSFEETIEEEGEELVGSDIADDPEALMDAIITLDDLFKAGDLPEDLYRQRRLALKSRLKEIIGE